MSDQKVQNDAIRAFAVSNVNLAGPYGTDRRGAKRTVPMEVLSLGFPRSGTASMHTALEKLGYGSVHHMAHCIQNVSDNDLWHEAARAKWFGQGKRFGRNEFDQVLGYCSATTDWPTAAFADDVIQAYPEAKVILTERDFDAWHKSITSTIGKSLVSPMIRSIGVLDPGYLGRWIPAVRCMWLGYFGDFNFEKAAMRKKFDEHHAMIRREVPPERLLNYRLGDGWGPLCEFLGKEIPDEPFPRVNEAAQFDETIGVIMMARLKVALKKAAKVLVPVSVAVVGVYVAKRQGVF